jgi:hypothetical protein
MEKNKAKRINMSTAKKVRKGKMARKQKERQEKVKKDIIEQLSKSLEDPANIELIRLIPEIKNKIWVK